MAGASSRPLTYNQVGFSIAGNSGQEQGRSCLSIWCITTEIGPRGDSVLVSYRSSMLKVANE